MKETGSGAPRTAEAISADSINRLVDAASRLREVRNAQRRFLRRWANERFRAISRLLDRPAFDPRSRRFIDG